MEIFLTLPELGEGGASRP